MDIGLISVIIPVYNTEKYVERCVRSVTDQTYQNLEIILINDGSTDQSLAVCERLQKEDARIRVYSQENQGLSEARNTGMRKMLGDYIFFVDSDDYLMTDGIEQLAMQMENGQADLVCGAVQLVYESGSSKPYTKTDYLELRTEDALYHCMFSNTLGSMAWGKLYKKELFQQIWFPTGRYSEDEFTTYKAVARANRIIYTGKILYNYFQREGSIIQSGQFERALDFFDAWQERELFLRERGYQELADKTAELIVREAYKRVYHIVDKSKLATIRGAVEFVNKERKQLRTISWITKLKMYIKIILVRSYILMESRKAI